jgi:peptidoglycan/LPS O-acetylase OafA/YrhL
MHATLKSPSMKPVDRLDGLPRQSTEASPTPGPAPAPRLRLEVLDAVRGLAALVVVFFHIKVMLAPITDTLSKPYRLWAKIMDHGHDSVVVFIVLSGFVLTLPIVRAGKIQLNGGALDYFRRRARRILPPYFAAFLIFVLVGWIWAVFTPTLSHHGIAAGENPFVTNGTTLWGILSHLVLIHNFNRDWALAVDAPMWSVATEWHIYFFFPLILLPIWRKIGLFPAVAAGFAVGLIPLMLLPRGTDFDTWCPWFLGTFATGMAAAAVAMAPPGNRLSKGTTRWAAAALAVVLFILFAQAGLPRVWQRIGAWEKDAATGLAVALFLVYLARCQMGTSPHPIVFRVLDSRPAVFLGGFSYSLYLVHHPVIHALDPIIAAMTRSPQAHEVAMYIFGPIVSLVAAYLFYLAFEKPFLRGRPKVVATAQ